MKPWCVWLGDVQTDRGWFGELFTFVKFEGDVPTTEIPSVEIKDWLGLGSPQIVLRFKYAVASKEQRMNREALAVIGVGKSGTPSYFVLTTVSIDQRGVVVTPESWSVAVDTDGHGTLRVARQIGTPPDRIPIGETAITFP
jgi:hypothetical protein